MKYEVLVIESMGGRTDNDAPFQVPPMAMWTEVFDNESDARAYIETTADAMKRDEQKDPGLIYTFITNVYMDYEKLLDHGWDLKDLPIVEFDN